MNCASLVLTLALVQDIKRDVPYNEPALERQILDIYSPEGAKDLPVVFWIHGGGWVVGDKSGVQEKPRAFMKRGYVFVSTNYRLLFNVEIKTIFEDIAKSIGWVYRNIKKHGGDPNRIFVMGHSAGAQLAALVCIDDRYLKAEGVPFSALKGCVPVDGDTFDLPAVIEMVEVGLRAHGEPLPTRGHRQKFGNDPKKHIDYSAVTHVAKGKGIPPFFILYFSGNPLTRYQARRLDRVLKAAGIQSRAYGVRNTNHGKINADIGVEGNAATKDLDAFMKAALKK